MLPIFLMNANFHFFLLMVDQEMSISVFRAKCLYCGGTLHQANYPRSPMGVPSNFREYYEERLSFCCDTCRRRSTPESVRFFGRRWYSAAFFMFICLLQLGITERRLAQFKKHTGMTVSEKTWKRWRKWWRECFVSTPFWQQYKGLVIINIDDSPALPRALYEVFSGTSSERMRLLLRFLSPLTSGMSQVM